jgi:hypothetical protein
LAIGTFHAWAIAATLTASVKPPTHTMLGWRTLVDLGLADPDPPAPSLSSPEREFMPEAEG